MMMIMVMRLMDEGRPWGWIWVRRWWSWWWGGDWRRWGVVWWGYEEGGAKREMGCVGLVDGDDDDQRGWRWCIWPDHYGDGDDDIYREEKRGVIRVSN